MESESQSEMSYGNEVFGVTTPLQDTSNGGELITMSNSQHNVTPEYSISGQPNGLNHVSTSDVQQSSSAAPITSSSEGTPSLPPVHMDLRGQLKRQIEYYFSRENLNHDTYLVSQMDPDQYVDISIIASFNQVKRLTSDCNLMVDVLHDSVCVQVDQTGTKIRPLHKRTVLILREIPEGTTQEEIEEIFNHSSCPSFVSCEYASGNCWYVNFETEEQAQDAFKYIREILQTFKGQRIMARIKAKPSNGITVPPRSAEPSRANGLMSQPVDPVRAHPTQPLPTAQSAIRYPMTLPPHFPLQNPPFAIQGGYPFMNYVGVIQHPLVPSWNPTAVYPDPATFGYDINGYGYPTMSGQPRQGLVNSARQNERRNHSRPSSNTSERGSELTTQSATQSATTTTAPKNTTNSQYYSGNGRGHGECSSHHKQHNGGEKLPGRGRSYPGGHSTNDQYYNLSDNIPPRHREAAQNYRLHKRMSATHSNNHLAQTNQSQMHSALALPPRRSGNHHHPRANAAVSVASHNPPHHQPRVNSSTGHDSRIDRGNREYNHRQNQNTDQHIQHAHTRNHGAHRNSKSPDKDLEQQQSAEIIRSQSFELDSSAFPALPGAMTAVSPTASIISQPQLNSDNNAAAAITTTPATTAASSNTGTQVANSTMDTTKSAASALTIDTEKTKGITETVAKLSDIVKSNIPEAAKLSDIVKGVNKPSTSIPTSPHIKDSTEKPVQASVTKAPNAINNKPHNVPAHHKVRPVHLTNGAHPSTDSVNRNVHKSKLSNPSKSIDANSAKAPSQTEITKVQTHGKESNVDKSSAVHETKATPSPQVSPMDHKVSYAAMAQRVAAANQLAAQKTSHNQDQAPASHVNPSAGDNNNNADNKPLPPTKSDNLYSSTAAKNTLNSTNVTSNGPRKPPQSQHTRNGPIKPHKNNPATSPTSPPSRTPGSQAVSSAVVAR